MKTANGYGTGEAVLIRTPIGLRVGLYSEGSPNVMPPCVLHQELGYAWYQGDTPSFFRGSDLVVDVVENFKCYQQHDLWFIEALSTNKKLKVYYRNDKGTRPKKNAGGNPSLCVHKKGAEGEETLQPNNKLSQLIPPYPKCFVIQRRGNEEILKECATSLSIDVVENKVEAHMLISATHAQGVTWKDISNSTDMAASTLRKWRADILAEATNVPAYATNKTIEWI